MAVSKMADLLVKEGASRWKDFMGNISDLARSRIIDEGVSKPVENYIRGINKGTANITRNIGYARGDINQLTMDQGKKAYNRVQKQLLQAQRGGDLAGAKINQNVIDHFHQGYRGANPLANGGNSRRWTLAVTDPSAKVIHTKKYDPLISLTKDNDKRLFEALLNRHEAYEAVAAEKGLRNYYNNQGKFTQRALDRIRKMDPSYASIPDAQLLSTLQSQLPSGTNMDVVLSNLAIKYPGKFVEDNGRRQIMRSNHLDANVLTKERTIMDQLPYKDNKGYNFLRKVRDAEYSAMNSGAGYTPAQGVANFGKKNAKKFFQASRGAIQDGGRLFMPVY